MKWARVVTESLKQAAETEMGAQIMCKILWA